VSSEQWTLDPEAENQYLNPWLLDEQDPFLRERVTTYIAGVVTDPKREHLEDKDKRTGTPLGVYSVQIPGTAVAMIWTLNEAERKVILAYLGPAQL
jgi:hypothetical protein